MLHAACLARLFECSRIVLIRIQLCHVHRYVQFVGTRYAKINCAFILHKNNFATTTLCTLVLYRNPCGFLGIKYFSEHSGRYTHSSVRVIVVLFYIAEVLFAVKSRPLTTDHLVLSLSPVPDPAPT